MTKSSIDKVKAIKAPVKIAVEREGITTLNNALKGLHPKSLAASYNVSSVCSSLGRIIMMTYGMVKKTWATSMEVKPNTFGKIGFSKEKIIIMLIPVTISELSIGISFKKSIAFLALLERALIPIEANNPAIVAMNVAQKLTKRESKIDVNNCLFVNISLKLSKVKPPQLRGVIELALALNDW